MAIHLSISSNLQPRAQTGIARSENHYERKRDVSIKHSIHEKLLTPLSGHQRNSPCAESTIINLNTTFIKPLN